MHNKTVRTDSAAPAWIYQSHYTPSPIVPHPEPVPREGTRVKWRPDVNYCVNGTGWARGTYLEALDPESTYRSICFTCRVWRREPLLGLRPYALARWRATHNQDGSRRDPDDAEARMKEVQDIKLSCVCPTCCARKIWVDARFEAPGQRKPLKDWQKKYDEWLKLPGAFDATHPMFQGFYGEV